MALIELEKIKFNYADKELYNSISMKINDKEHCALVGVNGSGKTTLLNILTKNLLPDEGKVIWTPHVTFSYLDQTLKVDEDMNTFDYLFSVYSHLFKKEEEMNRLYELSSTDIDNYEKQLNKAQNIQDELMINDFYSLKEKVSKIISGLGVSRDRLELPLSKLSSGQREKVYLAKMLLEEHDVLIMDEPTNFLDASQVNWLADYLNNYPKSFLVVSHDQEFLRKIANVVFSLENKNLVRYKATFDEFLVAHDLDKEMYEKQYNAQQRYIKKEEAFIAKNLVRATSSRAAKSRRTRLSHLERLEAPGKEESKGHFNFPFSSFVGDKVLEVNELVIGYDNKPLLNPISFTLKKGEKIAILGKNGVGKTTFLKTILGRLPSIEGNYKWLDRITINYYDQETKLDMNKTPFEFIKDHYPDMNNTEVRTCLGSNGVTSTLAMRKMKELSGGEVTKTRFALMSLKKSNFLILDEPTNHLDVKSKDELFKAIEKYPGNVIIVSHEKDFYDGLVDYEINF